MLQPGNPNPRDSSLALREQATPHDPQRYFGELTLARDRLQAAEDHGQMLSHISSPGWAEEKHFRWDQPAFSGGQTGPHARDRRHTSSWASSSEVGSAPGSPTYIAHVDGSLVNLHLLLSCLREETCRDTRSCWTESHEPSARGTTVPAGLLPARPPPS